MNVNLTYSKESISSDQNSEKIKKYITQYIEYFLLEYLKNNMTEKDINSMNEFADLIDNENIHKLQTTLMDMLNFQTATDDEKSIKNIINETLVDFEEELTVLTGQKSMQMSKEFEIDMV
jgi:hypothetical protein